MLCFSEATDSVTWSFLSSTLDRLSLPYKIVNHLMKVQTLLGWNPIYNIFALWRSFLIALLFEFIELKKKNTNESIVREHKSIAFMEDLRGKWTKQLLNFKRYPSLQMDTTGETFKIWTSLNSKCCQAI